MRCRICELRFYFSLSLPISPNGLYQVHKRLYIESYTPRTWRTHPLHLIPPEPYSQSNPQATQCLNWIFLISSLNFSFWSEREGYNDRFGVEWRTGWGEERRTVHTGYWSLVAAIDRGLPLISIFPQNVFNFFRFSIIALEEGISITDPSFYASEDLCPDVLISHIFRPASQCSEAIPLLKERIAILREAGGILHTVSFLVYLFIIQLDLRINFNFCSNSVVLFKHL